MAKTVMMKHSSGLVKKGFYGFSWTTWFFSGIPAIFRGDWLTGGILLLIGWTTGTLASLIWAFIYNKKYTLKLIETGYVFADSPQTVAAAQAALGVGENVGVEKGRAEGQQASPLQPAPQGTFTQDPATKFNWVAFWLAPYYYAGYGRFYKGLMFVLLMVIPPAGVVIAIYSGKKANKELPVGKVPFKWGPAIGLFCITMIYAAILGMVEQYVDENDASKPLSIVKQEQQTLNNVLVEKTAEQTEDVSTSTVKKRKASDAVSSASVFASSTVAPTTKHNYEPRNIVDGSTSTAWCSHGGKGNWVEIQFIDEVDTEGMYIVPGYGANSQAFLRNNRIKSANIELSSGKSFTVNFLDQPDRQEVRINEATKSVRITILDVYPGNKDNDSCISEISFSR